MRSTQIKMSLREQVQKMVGEDEELNPEEVTLRTIVSHCTLVQQSHSWWVENWFPNSWGQEIPGGIHELGTFVNESNVTKVYRQLPRRT